MRIKPLSANFATGRTPRSTEVANAPHTSTLESAVITNSIHVPTGRTPRSTEVANASRTSTLESADITNSIHVPTGRTPRSTEVANASHTSTLESADIMNSIHVPTGRTLRSTEVANASRMSLIDEDLIKGIVSTCIQYYKPQAMPTVESIRAILTDAYVSTDENYGIKEAIEWAEGF